MNTAMCIERVSGFFDRSDGPVAVWCAVTLAVLGQSDGPAVRGADGLVRLWFGGVEFTAHPDPQGSQWLVLHAMAVDTRPRHPYQLPDGTIAWVAFDHGEVPPHMVDFTFKGGRVMWIPLVPAVRQ